MSDLELTVRPLRATVDAKAFSDALKNVALILKRSAIPILEEVSVRFSGGLCILTATDMTTWMMAEIPAQGDDFSFVFARTKSVERACRCFMGSLTMELTEDGGPVRLSCGSKAGEFDTYSINDCPDVPSVDSEVAFRTNAADLMERIRRVSYAASRSDQESRERVSCVEFSGRQVYALDGYRAAWDDGEADFPQPFLVHAVPLHHLKVFGSRQVEFRFAKPRLSVTDGTTTIIFHTADSEPYQLASAVPQRYVEEFSVSLKELLSGLLYLQAAAPKTRRPYVYLRGKELSMTVNDRKYSVGLDIDRSGDTEVGLNLRYAVDALKQFAKEKSVTIKISGTITPIVIEAEGRNDCAMVLPLRSGVRAAA